MKGLAYRASELAESGILPDPVIRAGIRRLVGNRRSQIQSMNRRDQKAFIAKMNVSPIALLPDVANEQHYELPAEFFAEILGANRKYSCCLWSNGAQTLDEAEEAALYVSCQRALIADHQRVLDLGCGWGSLSLWIATHYPSTTVTSVSNSSSQRKFIEQQARQRGLSNLRVITADMNNFSCNEKFDRVVSLEMFEHMRNYAVMFRKISSWLEDDGYFFMHIFCHRSAAYEFVDAGPADWMSRHFFSGGIMPSDDLPFRFRQDLAVTHHWRWSGQEYQKTAEAWLRNMDDRKESVLPILEAVYGEQDAARWWMRWRIFFLSVSEMFGAASGEDWRVGHYLLQPRRSVESVF